MKRIHVRYHLKLDPAKREIAENVLGFHADHCPVARTLRGSVDITTSLETEDSHYTDSVNHLHNVTQQCGPEVYDWLS